MLSGLIFILIFEITITDVEISVINSILNYKYISILFTLICIVYLTQAFNIIDGLNGLSLVTSAICFLSFGTIAFYSNDLEIFKFSIYFIMIILGVLIFNFPFGKIFIGDLERTS